METEASRTALVDRDAVGRVFQPAALVVGDAVGRENRAALVVGNAVGGVGHPVPRGQP